MTNEKRGKRRGDSGEEKEGDSGGNRERNYLLAIN